MKRILRSSKRAAALCAAMLFMFLLTVPALADAWVPPDNHYNYGFETEAGVRLVSLFLSNYAETGMTSYSTGTPSFKLCSVVLKDLELNASQFKEGVTVATDASGAQYMTVTADRFEKRAKSLFPGSVVRASDCPGYSGGNITVTAANANGDIDIVATVDIITYEGDYVYAVNFSVWLVNTGSLSAVYGRTSEVPEAKVTKLSEGNARFAYSGSKKIKDISTWELELVDYQTGGDFAASSSVLAENAPYTPGGGSPAVSVPAADPSSAEAAQPGGGEEDSNADDGNTAEPAPQTEPQEEKGFLQRFFGGRQNDEQQGGVDRSGRTTLYIVIVLAAAVIVLLAVLIILVVIKKR